MFENERSFRITNLCVYIHNKAVGVNCTINACDDHIMS